MEAFAKSIAKSVQGMMNPAARWVWLSIGGNDLLGYSAAGQEAIAAESIDRDIRLMLNALFEIHPQI